MLPPAHHPSNRSARRAGKTIQGPITGGQAIIDLFPNHGSGIRIYQRGSILMLSILQQGIVENCLALSLDFNGDGDLEFITGQGGAGFHSQGPPLHGAGGVFLG